ncbi:unnamed protein product [Allacma fusca]|uniref:Metalloendopeptidase OMA1, mitochondrial n=1 Tax=Allacma fusca TaxID=39272 RepID=A0A8J2P6R6_9HEXA|nr:unnamed protein product [Allacma fusca]
MAKREEQRTWTSSDETSHLFRCSSKACERNFKAPRLDLSGGNISRQQLTRNFSQLVANNKKPPPFINTRPNVNITSPVRPFRTTNSNNVPLPPFIILIVGRVAKAGAVLLGRNVRKWWANLPPEQKAEYTQRAKSNRKYIGAAFGMLGMGIFVYYDSHIQETPYTNRKRFVAFKPEQFEQLARQEFESLVESFKPLIVPANPRDPAYRRVSRVANNILKSNKDLEQIRNKEWTITVVNDETIQNAFVLPSGNIFVFTGMLDVCETDDELAVILAHEMAHAVLGHAAENASYCHLMDLVMVIPIALLWAILPSDWSSAFAHAVGSGLQGILLSLPYSRAMEMEADEVGLFLAAKACFDIRLAPIFWAKMAYVGTKGGEPQIEWLSTHPNHESRQNRLEEVMSSALTVREDCQCPRLPLLDPKSYLEKYKRKVAETETFDNVAIRLRAV